MLFMLGFLVMGFGLVAIGIPPTAEEFMRVIFFLVVSLFYVAFWLNLSIFFSIRFKQAATSALACVAIWLFFSVFYNMIINLVGKALSPSAWASDYQVIAYQRFMLNLLRFAPSELFNEATMTLLMPFRAESGTVDNGAGAWCDSKSVAFRPESFGCLAATDWIDCCDSCMFCIVVCLFYEERSTVKVNNMLINQCVNQ